MNIDEEDIKRLLHGTGVDPAWYPEIESRLHKLLDARFLNLRVSSIFDRGSAHRDPDYTKMVESELSYRLANQLARVVRTYPDHVDSPFQTMMSAVLRIDPDCLKDGYCRLLEEEQHDA